MSSSSKAIVLLLALVGVVFGVDSSGKDVSTFSLMGDNIRNFLEELRARMHMDMTEELGIPRLDPFTADSLQLNPNEFGDTGLGDFAINMTNILAIGLNQFVVDDADFLLVGLSFKLNISLPTNLTITGDYESDGLIGGIFPMKGKGAFRIVITGLNLAVNGQLQYSAATWTIRRLAIYFGIKQLDVDFQGIDRLGDLMNEMLSETGPEIVDELWPTIEPAVVAMVTEMIEASLSELTLPDLLAILAGTKDIFPPITDS